MGIALYYPDPSRIYKIIPSKDDSKLHLMPINIEQFDHSNKKTLSALELKSNIHVDDKKIKIQSKTL